LGLYIVKNIVDIQNGDISVGNYIGKGTSYKSDFDVVEQKLDAVATEAVVYDLGGKRFLWSKIIL
jgi:signal transduction histidine kinase